MSKCLVVRFSEPLFDVSFLRFGVPAYVYPTLGPEMWETLTADLGPLDLVVATPDSGPGDSVDPNYSAVITAMAAKTPVYGYIDSGFEVVPAVDVTPQVDDWQTFYPEISGIFFDEVTSSGADLVYLQAVADYVHGADLKFALNPGQPIIDDEVIPMADVICNFEGTAADYLALDFPANAFTTARSKWWHLIHTCDPEDLEAVFAKARASNCGRIFVTDTGMPLPWDHLPPYWASEKAMRTAAQP